MAARPKISFFMDHNVARSVGIALIERGHAVEFLSENMPKDSPDAMVAQTCVASKMVLVTHDQDFKANSKKLSLTQSFYREKLHKICLGCHEPQAEDRVKAAMEFVEREWALAKKQKRTLWLELRPRSLVTYR